MTNDDNCLIFTVADWSIPHRENKKVAHDFLHLVALDMGKGHEYTFIDIFCTDPTQKAFY